MFTHFLTKGNLEAFFNAFTSTTDEIQLNDNTKQSSLLMKIYYAKYFDTA